MKKHKRGQKKVGVSRQVAVVLCFLWKCLTAPLTKAHRWLVFHSIAITQVGEPAYPFSSWHGCAAVRELSRRAQMLSTDLGQLECCEVRSFKELAFKVNRPKLLKQMRASEMRSFAKQFARYGYEASQLRIATDGTSILYILS